MSRWALALALAALGGCEQDSVVQTPEAADAPEEPAPPLGAGAATAREAVTGFFEAVEADDCEGMLAVVAGGLAERIHQRGCDVALEELHHMGMKLIDIPSVEPDGRDDSAVIVHANLDLGDGPKPTTLLVVNRNARFHLTSL